MLHRCPRPETRVLFSAIILALVAPGCAPAATNPTSTPSPTALVEMRVKPSTAVLRTGETLALLAEGRDEQQTWREIKVIWSVDPENLGALEAASSQTEGITRTVFTAKEFGRVKITARPSFPSHLKGEATVQIVGSRTAALPSPAVSSGTPPLRVRPTITARPTPAVSDTPELRQAIIRLDQLDRQVLDAAGTFVKAFRDFGSKSITEAEFCAKVSQAVPQMDKAVGALQQFQPPADLKSVYDQYLAAATKMRGALSELSNYCQTPDKARIGAYGQLMLDGTMKSVTAKRDLEAIADAIGMTIPRPPTPTRPAATS